MAMPASSSSSADPPSPGGPGGPFLVLPPEPLEVRGDGLVLREWAERDLPAMTVLFDDPQVARWTPLASPFDLRAAGEYLERARRSRAEGSRVHLAVTEDGEAPLGEVLLFRPSRPGDDLTDGPAAGGRAAELGYAVGAAHRGRGLAARAVRVLRAYAYDVLGVERTLLRIGSANAASAAVARASGFRPTAAPPVEGDGPAFPLLTWEHRRTAQRSVP